MLACGDSEHEPRPPVRRPPIVAVAPTPVAELTGWPPGLGRAFVIRLGSQAGYRLVVPELGDRRFADSLISVKLGDSIPVAFLGRRGNAGEAVVRVADAEAGAGACVTWPSAEILGVTFAGRTGAAEWRVAAERDSVIPIVVDTLLGMNSQDSLSLALSVLSLLPSLPPALDSVLHGIPFTVMRAYRFRVADIHVVAAEVARTSSSEADPRQQRLFLVGERTADAQSHELVFSRDATGPADMVPVTELMVSFMSRRSRNPVLVLGVEGSRGMRLLLVQRTGRKQWRTSWGSVVEFC